MNPAKQREVDTVRPPSMGGSPKRSGTYAMGTYGKAADDEPPALYEPYEEDELTPVHLACLVCKGRVFLVQESGNSYSGTRCGWCTNGTMSGEQVNRYLNRDKLKAKDIETMLRRYVEE